MFTLRMVTKCTMKSRIMWQFVHTHSRIQSCKDVLFPELPMQGVMHQMPPFIPRQPRMIGLEIVLPIRTMACSWMPGRKDKRVGRFVLRMQHWVGGWVIPCMAAVALDCIRLDTVAISPK